MTIDIAYCFDQNNDLAHRSAFANRLLPTCPSFKLLPLIGGGGICHGEKLFKRSYNARL